MAYTLHAIRETKAIGDDAVVTRFVYIDKKSGKTMTVIEPLHPSDDVASLRAVAPRREHITERGAIRLVTIWERSAH